MRIKLKTLKRIIREEMMPGPSGTPDQALSAANKDQGSAGFTRSQKAAMGFMNNVMGPEPSADQLDGLSSQISSYAQQNDVSPAALKSHLQKILPAKPQHPQYQYDAASGAVSSSDGRKVYGEMKVTPSSLRKIIREVIDIVNSETGEIIDFGEDSISGIPDEAVPDLINRLGLNLSPSGEALSNEDWEKLEAETVGKQDRRASKKKHAQFMADEERLNVDNLLQRLRYWAEDAAQDYISDNPGTDLQDIAYDLAAAAEYEFEQDEWDELLWHFDGEEAELRVYTADSMG